MIARLLPCGTPGMNERLSHTYGEVVDDGGKIPGYVTLRMADGEVVCSSRDLVEFAHSDNVTMMRAA